MAIEVGSSAAGKAARTGDPWVRLPGAWPLVGRREELAFVSDLLRRGVGGIVLAGAAGVGKTRLAREILEAAEAKGFATAWATATQAVPDAIVGLWKDGASDYVELQPLSEDDLARLLAGALGGEVEAGMSRRLW